MGTRDIHDPMDVISELEFCATEEDARDLTAAIIAGLGANWFVYTTMLPPDLEKVEESYHYVVGCRPELCEMYRTRMWRMIDPFQEYALSHCAPVLRSRIKAVTPGQAEILRCGTEHGFRSALVVPTHTSNRRRRLGLLYVGSELPEAEGEPLLWRKRGHFTALGHELLLWWNNKLRHQAMRCYSLIEDEVEILKMVRNGKRANEIAALYDVKPPTIYRKWESIKAKFDVAKIDQAVATAEAVGLLE